MSAFRRLASRRSASIFSFILNGIPKLSCPYHCVLSRRRDEWHLDARCWFASIGSIASRCLYWLHLQFVVGVSTIGVATLGVCFPMLCPLASLGSFVQNMASCVGVVTLAVGFTTSCSVASLGPSTLHIVYYFGIAMTGATPVVVASYVSCMLS